MYLYVLRITNHTLIIICVSHASYTFTCDTIYSIIRVSECVYHTLMTGSVEEEGVGMV